MQERYINYTAPVSAFSVGPLLILFIVILLAVVMVGYENTAYTITQEKDFVDVCVISRSPGIEEDFFLITVPRHTPFGE